MEKPEQQLQDQLDAERKIRRNLQKQLQTKEDALEKLKGAKKISPKEYQNALQELYANQENNERLINDMAKRYSELDYDQLDEFYRQVSYHIENGELVKADELLKTKGDISQQVSDIRQRGQVLNEKKALLQEADAVHQADIHEAAQRCYSYFETFAAQSLIDTAAYYLELRASLDTTNLEWVNNAGRFIHDYIGDYDKALSYYQLVLRNAREEYGENSDWVAVCYSNIGSAYASMGKYDQAQNYDDKAFVIRVALYGPNHPDVATCYNNKAWICMKQGQYDEALEFYNHALRILMHNYGENHPLVATCYFNIAQTYYGQEEYDKSAEYHLKALSLRQALLPSNHPDLAYSYNDIGNLCLNLGQYDNALIYLDNALAIWSAAYGINHPMVLRCRGNIGSAYMLKGLDFGQQGDFESSLDNLNRALPLLKTAYGDDYEIVIQLQQIIDKMQSINQQK
jgi:tetratricopeptide (TPR) repeat protein